MEEKKEYKITLKGILGHLNVVNKHRFKVFCLCCKVGIPFQGLIHDLSKYSPTEFFEGAKYFEGSYSPIRNCKKEKGYSEAWLHHKGRNKHHYEYWYDPDTREQNPVLPFKYFLEMVCDNVAAGMTYEGKNWTKEYQLTYWNKVKGHATVNKKIAKLLEKVYTELSINGPNKILNKKYLKSLYDEYTK